MNEIYLTHREKRILFFLRFKKKMKIKDSDAYPLLNFKLIEHNYLSETDDFGCVIDDGTYSLTDNYTRFRIAEQQDFFHRIFTPITVTVLTNIVLYALRLLLRLIQQRLF